jgi:hypothetical protein
VFALDLLTLPSNLRPCFLLPLLKKVDLIMDRSKLSLALRRIIGYARQCGSRRVGSRMLPQRRTAAEESASSAAVRFPLPQHNYDLIMSVHIEHYNETGHTCSAIQLVGVTDYITGTCNHRGCEFFVPLKYRARDVELVPYDPRSN